MIDTPKLNERVLSWMKDPARREKVLQANEIARLQLERIEATRATLTDPREQEIFRLRCDLCMTWEEIGRVLYIDRRTAARIFRRIWAD